MRNFLGKLMVALLFCYLVAFPFGQLTRIPLVLASFPEVHLYLTDIFLLGLFGAWGIRVIGKRKKRYSLPSLAIPIFSFIVVGCLSLVRASLSLRGREVTVASLYLLRWLAYSGLYFVLADLKKHCRCLRQENLINFLIGLGVSVAIFGLVQLAFWPNLRPMESWGWDPHFYRLVGTFFDPGFTGIILVLTLVLMVARLLDTCRWPQFLSPRRVPRRLAGSPSEVEASFVAVGVLGLVVYLALALTYSRASYLAWLIGMGILAVVKKTPRLFLAAVLIGVLTLVILPQPAGEGGKIGRTYTIGARVENWRQSLAIARDHLLLGVGFNAYRYAQRDYGFLGKYQWQESRAGSGTDSSLLFVLATTGVLGLLGYLGIFGKVILEKKVKRVKREETGRKSLLLASLGALFVHSFFLNSLFYPWVMGWLWILLAYGE